MKYFLLSLSAFLIGNTFAFSDVLPGTESHTAIEYIKNQNIVNGYDDGTFRPDWKINRVEFLKILLEADKTDRVCTERYFEYNDTVSGAWYDTYLQTASNCGIVQGYPDGSFRPANTINMAEAAKIIYFVFQDIIDNSSTAECKNLNTPWYAPYTCALENSGISVNPLITAEKEVTREDMAIMIYKTLTLPQEEVIETEPETEEPSEISQEENTLTNQNPPFYEDFDQIKYEELKSSNTPFVLNFSAIWCPICRALDTKLINQLNDLPNGATIFRVDYDTYSDLKQEFGITRQTSGVFFDENGNTEVHLGTLNYDKIKNFFE